MQFHINLKQLIFSVSVISTVILFLESDTKTEIKKTFLEKNKTYIKEKPTTKTSKK